MRGLKHLGLDWKHHRHKSHLLQMRGLKRETDAKVNLSEVASFTDAWIETSQCHQETEANQSHLLQMRGLKLLFLTTAVLIWSRIFYRCVD